MVGTGRGITKGADTLTGLGSFLTACLEVMTLIPSGGGAEEVGKNLLVVERMMISKMWRNCFEDKGMTWDWGRGAVP